MVLLALGLAAGAGADSPLAAAQLAPRINRGPGCTQIRVLGPCLCGNVPCGVRIAMYVPVAFGETVQRPGDTLLDLPPALALLAAQLAPATGSSRHSALDHTAEVHAWSLGDDAWLMASPADCALCRPSDAAPSSSALPQLAYASEADALQWRTGVRDTLRAATWAASPDAVLGAWGPLYPRQMRDLGTSALVYSAKSVYRALSLARELPVGFSVPVDLAGRMQQAFPAVSACFAVGAQPLPEKGRSPQPAQTSVDGRDGWFYWRPVTCCVESSRFAACGGAH
jgi:hypothetical protein